MEFCIFCGGFIPAPKATGVLRPVEIHPDPADCEAHLDAKWGIKSHPRSVSSKKENPMHYVLRRAAGTDSAEVSPAFSAGSYIEQIEEMRRFFAARYAFHGLTEEGRAKK